MPGNLFKERNLEIFWDGRRVLENWISVSHALSRDAMQLCKCRTSTCNCNSDQHYIILYIATGICSLYRLTVLKTHRVYVFCGTLTIDVSC